MIESEIWGRADLRVLKSKPTEVNAALWDIEDSIRTRKGRRSSTAASSNSLGRSIYAMMNALPSRKRSTSCCNPK
jgi:hypothetical protein